MLRLRELCEGALDPLVHVDTVVLDLDLGRLGDLAQHLGHYRVHLEHPHEALRVLQVVVLLLDLPGRLVDGEEGCGGVSLMLWCRVAQ